MGQGREHPCQAGDKVGFEQRFERGGLDLAEKELGSLVGLGLRVQGRGEARMGPGPRVTKVRTLDIVLREVEATEGGGIGRTGIPMEGRWRTG